MAKKQPKKTRPRTMFLTMDLGQDLPVDGLRQEPPDIVALVKDGIPVDVEVAKLVVQYERQSGKPKVVASGRVDPKALTPNVLALITGYHAVYAIDANTKEICGQSVSVGAAIRAEFTRSEELPGKVDYLYDIIPVGLLIERDVPSPERCFLAMILAELAKGWATNEKQVAVIIDHNLGLIDAWNARKEPVFEDHSVPEGVTLIFATADATDTPPNHFINWCDRKAAYVLRLIQEGEPLESVKGRIKTLTYSAFPK